MSSLTCNICTKIIEDGPSYTCKRCNNRFCMNCGDDVDGKADLCYFCIMSLSTHISR